jgi:DNA-binding transcriptional ArsR family regulator
MVKETFHPNAFLSKIRNIKLGLEDRTLILATLEKQSCDAKTLAAENGMHYSVVAHHLRLLTAEGIVERKGSRKPYLWMLTGAGQKRLLNSS